MTMADRLTDHEREILPLVVDILKDRRGRGMELSASMICQVLRRLGYHADGIMVRAIVNHIRTGCVIPCLAASNTGYYVALTRDDMDACISSLERMVEAINEVIQSLTAQRDARFNRTNDLFT